MSKNLIRQYIRESLLLEQNSKLQTKAPPSLKGVEWDEISSGTLMQQIEKLAKLSQERYSTEFYPSFAKDGQFNIDPSSEAGKAYKIAYSNSKERNKGLKAEDGLIAFYKALKRGVTKPDSGGGQKGGEDLWLGNDRGELKTSGKNSLNVALNSTAPHNNANNYYIFMNNRDSDSPRIIIVNSQVLYYRNFQRLAGIDPETGELDNKRLEDSIKAALKKSMGNLDIDNIIAQSAMSTRPEDVNLSFTLGGLSVRLRLMFTLKGKLPPKEESEIEDVEIKVESLSVIKNKPMLNENHFKAMAPQVLLEELTKKDVEKIAKDTARKEIIRVVGNDFAKSVQEEIKKALGQKATKEQVADISKQVLKKLYREMSHSYNPLIDRIKL